MMYSILLCTPLHPSFLSNGSSWSRTAHWLLQRMGSGQEQREEQRGNLMSPEKRRRRNAFWMKVEKMEKLWAQLLKICPSGGCGSFIFSLHIMSRRSSCRTTRMLYEFCHLASEDTARMSTWVNQRREDNALNSATKKENSNHGE